MSDHVLINNVRYVPATDGVVANRIDILRALIASYWGDCSKEPDSWVEEISKGLFVNVWESSIVKGSPSLSELADDLAEKMADRSFEDE